jgi:hypothetical protein
MFLFSNFEGSLNLPSDDQALLNRSMPVGPVAGGIMGFFLLLALGLYCYRHHARGHSHSCNGSLPGEGHLRDSNNDLEDFDDIGKGICALTRETKYLNLRIVPFSKNYLKTVTCI